MGNIETPILGDGLCLRQGPQLWKLLIFLEKVL